MDWAHSETAGTGHRDRPQTALQREPARLEAPRCATRRRGATCRPYARARRARWPGAGSRRGAASRPCPRRARRPEPACVRPPAARAPPGAPRPARLPGRGTGDGPGRGLPLGSARRTSARARAPRRARRAARTDRGAVAETRRTIGTRPSSRSALEQDDRQARDPLARADRSDALGPLGFHADRPLEDPTQSVDEPDAVRSQHRRLEHDRAIDVDGPPSCVAHHGRHPAEDRHAVGTGPRRVRVREVLADVTDGGRPEHGVGHCVGDDVAIAVPGQAPRSLDGDAAEHEGPQRVGAEPVAVEAEAHPARHDRRSASSTTRSEGWVSLILRGSPGTTTMVPPAASTRAASSVASPPLRWAERSRSARNAWGVCTATSSVRSSVDTTRSPATCLTVSARGRPGTAPSTPGTSASTTARNSSTPPKGRAASWTTITSASSGTTSRPARTEAARLDPPPTTASTRRSSTRAGPGTTSTTPPATDRAASIDQSST